VCVCVSVASVIQHEMRTLQTVICGVSNSTIFFPLYLINDTIFERTLLNIECVFRFPLQLLTETFLILRRNERDMIKNVDWAPC